MPWSFAACSAPLRILSQNVSPGASCVTIAMIKSSPLPPPPPAFYAPPWLLHAANARVTAVTATSARSGLRVLLRRGLLEGRVTVGRRPAAAGCLTDDQQWGSPAWQAASQRRVYVRTM